MIVEVKVHAEESKESTGNQEVQDATIHLLQNSVLSPVKEKFYDKRNVVSWTPITKEEMKVRNPRLLQM